MKKVDPNLATIYLVRHGQSEHNVQQRMAGHVDTPLTPQGEREAKQLAQKLKHIHFDEAFSSDLVRAKRTAEIIALERKLAVKTTEKIREKSFGSYEGKLYKEFNDTFAHLFKAHDRLTDKQRFNSKLANDIETDDHAVTRLITFLREIAIAYPKKTILVVAHGSIMRYFLIRVGFSTYQTTSPDSISNLGYIKLESDGVDFFIKETQGIKFGEPKK